MHATRVVREDMFATGREAAIPFKDSGGSRGLLRAGVWETRTGEASRYAAGIGTGLTQPAQGSGKSAEP